MPGTPKAVLAAVAVWVAAAVGNAGLVADAAVSGRTTMGQELPDGSGKTTVAKLCSGCHDLMFTVSTREDEEGWTRIVNDMRSRGTDGTEAEFAAVIAYLATHMGKRQQPAAGHATLELLASRTKVTPGERFALGVNLVTSAGWRVKNAAAGPTFQVSWTKPEAVTIDGSSTSFSDGAATFVVFPAMAPADAAAGTTLDLAVRVAYEVCAETCVAESTAASINVPVGDGGRPIHQDKFAKTAVSSATPLR